MENMNNEGEQLSPRDFKFIRDLVYRETGIVIGEHKRQMIHRRLNKRSKALNINSLKKYCSILRDNPKDEMGNFINSVTTNLTSFYREQHHFDYLQDHFFPEFLASGKKRLRIWCSASSTGQEPYSIAITMLESLGNKLPQIDAKILATDLDTEVLKKARKGIYKDECIEDLPQALQRKWFSKSADKVNVDPQLREYISFNQLNLLGEWPMKGQFDVIFCRNVLIYFDKPTQKTITDRFKDYLIGHGILMLGHSESVLKDSNDFKSMGKTIYQKVCH